VKGAELTKKERSKIIEAVHLLMEEDCRFDEAMEILCKVISWEYPGSKLINLKTISVTELFNKPDSEFKVK